MKQRKIKRRKRIVAWFLLIAMVFTSQNMLVLATDLSEKDVRENKSKEQVLLDDQVISDYSSRVSMGKHCGSVITENGDLYYWGDNNDGQVVWDETERNQLLTPAKILSNVVSMSMKSRYYNIGFYNGGFRIYIYGSAIMENGDLYCWGYNDHGEVGNGTSSYQPMPTKILSNVVSTSMGERHRSAITENGDLYCWGDNLYGQVGVGSTYERRYYIEPIKVLSNVVSASMEDDCSMAITVNGDLYCWGYNDHGQVGDGTKANQLIPTKVLSNVVSASMKNDCSMAITSNGDLYCWGYNYCGKVGNGAEEDQLTPTKVLSNVVSISMGSSYSSAITSNGDLYCWGGSMNGTGKRQLTPTKVLSNVVSISMGSYDTSSAITSNGDLYCWGDNYWGEVGNGTTANQSTPTKILGNVVSASMGSRKGGAITSNGDLYCWGAVANGTGKQQLTPTKVLSNVVSISMGSYDTSSAITSNGDLYCWGSNVVGNGTTDNQLTPQKIMNLQTEEVYTSGTGNTGGNSPLHLNKDNSAILETEINIRAWLDSTENELENPITWTSSDLTIIDPSDATTTWVFEPQHGGGCTLTVTPKKAGTVTLTATTIDGITENLEIIVEPELVENETNYCLTERRTVTICSVTLPETDKEYLEMLMSGLVINYKTEFYGIDYTYDYEISDDGRSAKLIMDIDPTSSYEGYYEFEIKSPGGQAMPFRIYCQTGNYLWSGEGITEEDIVFDKAENEFLAAFDNFLNKTQSVIEKEGSKTAVSVDNLVEFLKKQYGAVVTFPGDLPKGWNNYVYEALSEKIADIANAKMSDISYSADAVSLGSNIVKSVYKDYKYINQSIEYENGKVVVDLNIWAMYGAFSGQIVCRSAQDKSKSYTMGVSMTKAQTEKVLQQYANDLAKLGASAANSVYFALAEDLLGKSLKDFTGDYIKKYLTKYEKKLADIGLGGFVDFCSKGYDMYNNINAFSTTLTNTDASKIYSQLKSNKEALKAFENSTTNNNAKRAGKKVVSAAEKILVLWEEYLTTGTVTSKGGIKGFIKNIFTCPVSISVYDSGDSQIGYVGDDEVWYDGSIYIEEIGDAKIIYTPFDEEVSFKVEGTGYGTLNCAFEEFDKNGDIIGRLNYYDVLLSLDTEISVELPSSDLIAEHSDMAINVDGTSVYASEYIPVDNYRDSSISVSLQVDNEAGGIVYGAGTYIVGNAVNLIALANEGYVFTGWYNKNNELVSIRRNMEFAARENVDYCAHFAALPDDNPDPDKKSLAQAEITLSQSSYNYDGDAKTPSVTVKLAGKTLMPDVDYTVSYSNNVNIGTANVIITGIGDYEGTAIKDFTISDGEASKADISQAEVALSQSQYVYDGTAKIPSVTVKLNGKTLVLNTDYIVSYNNNTNIGTATVTVTGIGNYVGTVVKNFEIKKEDGSDVPCIHQYVWITDKFPTQTEEGSRHLECLKCGDKKAYVKIPQILGSNNNNGKKPSDLGTIYLDASSKAIYKITKDDANARTVSYLKTKVTSGTLKVPDTIKFKGNTYRVTEIKDDASANNAKITKVVIGKNVKTIGTGAFSKCGKLNAVTVGRSVTSIGKNAFYGCSKLKTVTIGKNVTSIKSGAFSKCISLKQIGIPAKVKNIGSRAFYGCSNLKKLTIKTTKLTGKSIGSKAFSGISKKATVKVQKSKVKSYKKLLKKKGISKKAKVK